MSAKTLIIATAALAASTVMTLPALAAGGDGTGPNGTGPGPNPPAAAQTLPLRAQVLFDLLDTNHDGTVSKDEYAALSNAIFNALDKNHDGKLTPDELRGDFAMFGPRGGRGGPAMGPGGNWQGRFDGRGNWGRMDDRRGPPRGMFNRMGFNGQGPQQGAGYGPRLNFASIDTNHDGAISLDEFTAHMPYRGQWIAPAPQQQ